MTIIAVKHNIEVAHRLYETPGKCENIHGHSMWVTLYIEGAMDKHNMVRGLDFADVKKTFRGYLDTEFDHRVVLNAADPFAGPILQVQDVEVQRVGGWSPHDPERTLQVVKTDPMQQFLPGLATMNGDPTTEFLAQTIFLEMRSKYAGVKKVDVWETSVNMASYNGDYDGLLQERF